MKKSIKNQIVIALQARVYELEKHLRLAQTVNQDCVVSVLEKIKETIEWLKKQREEE